MSSEKELEKQKEKQLQDLHQKAVAARLHSHSPYSQHKVGAALLLKNGQVFSGCNVENSSYGGTVCAERVAIWKAVSELGSQVISDIVVVTDQKEPWPPCGFCRQVMAEFAHADTKIHLANLQGIQRSLLFSQIFPEAFHPSHLLS